MSYDSWASFWSTLYKTVYLFQIQECGVSIKKSLCLKFKYLLDTIKYNKNQIVTYR